MMQRDHLKDSTERVASIRKKKGTSFFLSPQSTTPLWPSTPPTSSSLFNLFHSRLNYTHNHGCRIEKYVSNQAVDSWAWQCSYHPTLYERTRKSYQQKAKAATFLRLWTGAIISKLALSLRLLYTDHKQPRLCKSVVLCRSHDKTAPSLLSPRGHSMTYSECEKVLMDSRDLA